MPFSFLLSLAAGLATMLGGIAAVLRRRPSRAVLNAALGFSAGVMLAVSLADLIPHAVSVLSIEMPGAAGVLSCVCACAAGILAARLLDLMVECRRDDEGRLMKIGVFTMLALMLHNLPEGMAVYLSTEQDVILGMHLCAAIALHNVPEGIAVAMPICAATGSRLLALTMTAVSGFAEPLGALIMWKWLGLEPGSRGLALIFSGIAGLMTATAFYELLPEALGGKNREQGTAGALWGVIIMVAGCCIAS